MSGIAVHISPNQFPPLPTKHHTLSIWRELSREFDEYHVVARALDRSVSSSQLGNIYLHLIPAIRVRQSEFLFSQLLSLSHMKNRRADLIIAQCPVLGGCVAVRLAHRWQANLWVELHGSHYFSNLDPSLRGRFFRLLSKPVLRRATAIRALTNQMVHELRRDYGPDIADRAVVVPTRVDLSLFSSIKLDYAIPQDRPVRLICVGGYSPVKNHIGLLRVLSTASFPFHLQLVGDGPLREAYVQEIDQLGLRGRVTLGAWISQDQIAEQLRRSDVFVHCSLSEALPRAVLEAMAIGLPIIATDVGFVREAIEDGVSGLLTDSPIGTGFLAQLAAIMSSEQLRSRMGQSARQIVGSRYEGSKVFELYRRELRRTMNHGSRA